MPEELKQTSDKAAESLVLGLIPFVSIALLGVLVYAFGGLVLGIFLGVSIVLVAPVAGVLACITGHRARGSIRQSAGQIQGGRIATTGLTLGYLCLACWAFTIVAAIFISPHSDHSWAANQASAVGSLRTINFANITYSTTYDHGYATTLAALGPPKAEGSKTAGESSEKAAGLIDEILASGTKSGYRFTYVAGSRDSAGKVTAYTVHADPARPGVSGRMYYFTDQTNVIRVEKGNEAHEHSPPID